MDSGLSGSVTSMHPQMQSMTSQGWLREGLCGGDISLEDSNRYRCCEQRLNSGYDNIRMKMQQRPKNT